MDDTIAAAQRGRPVRPARPTSRPDERREIVGPSGAPMHGFRVHDLDHDSVRNLPQAPALVRLDGTEPTALVLVPDLSAWVESNEAELLASTRPGHRRLLWRRTSAAEAEELYRESRGTLGALREGRPAVVTRLNAAPDGWGLYRFTKPDGQVYVGISSNVRNRLYAHRSAGRLDLTGGDTVEVLDARQAGTIGVVTWADLQEAERFHIRKLRNRGITLVNIVAGGNGMPPRRRFNAPANAGFDVDVPTDQARWLAWDTRIESTEGQPESEHEVPVVDLHTVYAAVTGHWRLEVALEGTEVQVWALPPGVNKARQVNEEQITAIYLRNLYHADNPKRDLDADLATLTPPVYLPSSLTLRYWRPDAGQRDDRGRRRPPAQALLSVTRWHVLNRTLPEDVTEAGIEIDPDFARPQGGLNQVVRVRTADGAHLYLKVEETPAAANAELLTSAIWHRLGWPGCGDRVLLSHDRSVLIIPPVGDVRGIVDLGSFNKVFSHHPFERDGDTFAAERAGYLRAVPLSALNLEDPDDVLRFVATNGAWGNSDRHLDNVHFGWRSVPNAPAGGYGYLLPIDHGRCFFNNDPSRVGEVIHGSPAAAVTGRICNPHQLLRAFSDRAAVNPAAAAAVVGEWAVTVDQVVTKLGADPGWGRYYRELDAMSGRLGGLATDPDAFVAACQKVVLR